MKLTILLLTAFVLNAGARSTAQTVTLSVTNMPLEQVCKQIEKQTGYYFVYAKDLNTGSKSISMHVNKTDFHEVLRLIFDGLPYSYQIIDKVVVVNTVNKSVAQREQSPSPPDGTIRVDGRVLNEAGQPLAEASVTIKATGKGTITNERGEFMLPAVPVNSPLIISHIGYNPQTITPKEGQYLELKMAQAANILDASVVKGYYQTSNRLNTGNAVTVKAEVIEKQPVGDLTLALVGRVPGLSISQTSGVPGTYSTIQLRGENTIPLGKPSTANDPLYIIDGVPFSSQSLTSPYNGGGALGGPGASNNGPRGGMSPFNSINPLDIESITILKDADATAIYGSRGANGVILITTKKGAIGKNKIDIDFKSGVGKVTKRMNLLNTSEYLQMRREAFKNDGALANLDPANAASYPDLLIWDTTRYTDWQKTLIDNNSSFSNAQVNFSGGNNNLQFLVGGGYSRQGTLFPGNYLDQRASLHVSIAQTSLDQRLHLQLSLNYSNDNSNIPGVDLTRYITYAPDAPAIYDANGNLNWALYGGSATWYNPMAYTTARAKSITDYSGGTLNLMYSILPGLHFQTNLGYTRSEMNQMALVPSTGLPPPLNTDPGNRHANYGTSTTSTWLLEPQINYLRAMGQGQLEVVAGTTFQENRYSAIGMAGYNYANNSLLDNFSAAGEKIFFGNVATLYRYNALFARIGYNWSQKYILNLTARRDGSSRFGKDRQFGNFGAVGVAWIFSQEKFIQKAFPGLSFGKIRGSYGVTGNDGIGDYQFLSAYTLSSLSYQDVTGLAPTNISNPYLQWERVKKLEGAVELGFLKDKALFTFAWYRNRTDNELLTYPLPALAGFTGVASNLPALIQNTGTEWDLHTQNITSKNFSWNTYFNLSIPKNKLVSYPGLANSSFRYTYFVGQPLFIQFVYQYMGVDPATGNYQYASKRGTGSTGYVIDRKASKALTQAYYGSIQNSFIFKRLQLDLFVQIVKQNGLNYLYAFPIPGSQNNQPKEVLARWQRPGDKADIQRFSVFGSNGSGAAYGTFNASDGAISDASFARLKNLALSYQFPEQWQKRARLQSARIYVQCENLLTITNYRGLDPETRSLTLPPVRMITGGVQFKF